MASIMRCREFARMPWGARAEVLGGCSCSQLYRCSPAEWRIMSFYYPLPPPPPSVKMDYLSPGEGSGWQGAVEIWLAVRAAADRETVQDQSWWQAGLKTSACWIVFGIILLPILSSPKICSTSLHPPTCSQIQNLIFITCLSPDWESSRKMDGLLLALHITIIFGY